MCCWSPASTCAVCLFVCLSACLTLVDIVVGVLLNAIAVLEVVVELTCTHRHIDGQTDHCWNVVSGEYGVQGV